MLTGAAFIYIAYSRNSVAGPKATDAVSTFRISRFTHTEKGLSSTAAAASEVVLWTDNMGYPTAQDQYNYPVCPPPKDADSAAPLRLADLIRTGWVHLHD